MSDDEFYIGYEPVTPPSLARRTARATRATVVVAVVVALSVLVSHDDLAPARFDFGRPHPVAGTLTRTPYPALVSDGRKRLLVGGGKHGAERSLAGAADGHVRMDVTTIARHGVEMLEVVDGSVQPTDGGAASPPVTPPETPAGREVTLVGEIVDSKCFLGVMNPGEGTVHRDCAALCLRGGIPPALLVRGASGEEALVLLVRRDGGPIGVALADLAGLPVQVRGRLLRDSRGLVLAAEVSEYHRLTS